MGLLKSHAIFVVMMTVLRDKWNTLVKEPGLDTDQVVVVFKGEPLPEGGSQLRLQGCGGQCSALYTHHQAPDSVLRDCIGSPSRTVRYNQVKEVQVLPSAIGVCGSRHPFHWKFPGSERSCPYTWTDLRMVIDTFGFYQQWIEWNKFHIQPSHKLQTGACTPLHPLTRSHHVPPSYMSPTHNNWMNIWKLSHSAARLK